MSKEESYEKAYPLGFGYMKGYGVCSQCVFAAVTDMLGARDKIIARIGNCDFSRVTEEDIKIDRKIGDGL